MIWALGSHTYAVIEAKTGATAPLIWKKDINQLGGSVNWCATEYGTDATILPIVVHPSCTIERSGTPPPGTRVITTIKLRALKAAARNFARAVAEDGSYRQGTRVEQQLGHFRLAADAIIGEYTEAGRREPKKPAR